MVEDKVFNRWKKDYIDGINIQQIEYLTLNEETLKHFIVDNYFDDESCSFVSRQLDHYRPIGLKYLMFDNEVKNDPYTQNKRYLLGVCVNNKGTKTIVSVIKFIDGFIFSEDYTTPFTFFASVEVNEYFRQMGLCKSIVDVFSRQIYPFNPVLITGESVLGKKCGTINIIKDALSRNGFKESVQNVGEFTKWYYENQLQRILQQKSNQ